jgi:hypothetical protein
MDLLNARKNVLGLVSLVITAVIFLAGLWPFNFWPENKVKWLQDQNGVQFYGQAIMYSTIPFFQSSSFPLFLSFMSFASYLNPLTSFDCLPPAPYSLHPCSVELCLQPNTETSSHIGHIFSFLDEHGSESFFVGQWRSHLLLGKGIHGKKKLSRDGNKRCSKER